MMTNPRFLFYLVGIISALSFAKQVCAFSLSSSSSSTVSKLTRRDFFGLATAAATVATTTSSSPALAAFDKDSAKTFRQPLTKEFCLQRFQDGFKSLTELLDNYDTICEGGGDNVRRYLGTVGTSSGLWGISKVMTYLRDEVADDLVEFAEMQNELEKALRLADGAAYMAIFVTTSTSYTPPQKYFDDAKREIKIAKKVMEQMAKEQLNLQV